MARSGLEYGLPEERARKGVKPGLATVLSKLKDPIALDLPYLSPIWKKA